jgi:hypothetical protein
MSGVRSCNTRNNTCSNSKPQKYLKKSGGLWENNIIMATPSAKMTHELKKIKQLPALCDLGDYLDSF